MKRVVTGLMLGCLVGVAAAQPSTRSLSVEDRVYPRPGVSGSQGEPASNSNDYGLMLLLQKIDELEDEVQMLHGQLEELHHEVEANRKAERTRYVDVDARLKALAERNEAEATAEALEAETDVREQDREAYIAAREELLAKDYDGAVAGFTQYIEDYPEGQFRPFAHFWLGEIYRIKAKPDETSSIKEFSYVVDNYPEHSQVPAALYKIASLQAKKGDNAKAKATLQRIVQEHPNTNEARLAERMLGQL